MLEVISTILFIAGGALWMLGVIAFDRYRHAVPLIVYAGSGTTLCVIGWLL